MQLSHTFPRHNFENLSYTRPAALHTVFHFLHSFMPTEHSFSLRLQGCNKNVWKRCVRHFTTLQIHLCAYAHMQYCRADHQILAQRVCTQVRSVLVQRKGNMSSDKPDSFAFSSSLHPVIFSVRHNHPELNVRWTIFNRRAMTFEKCT